jgi:probable rRNA maturation factor
VNEPPSPTVGAGTVTVVGADEQQAVPIDVERWSALARAVLEAEGVVGELTLTFIDRDEIAALNREHLGHDAPTDVLSFPLDAAAEAPGGAGVPDRVFTSERRGSAAFDAAAEAPGGAGVPVLLGDVVVCPEIAAAQASEHAGTLDDELALLVVHGVLHVLGHDHAELDEATTMRERERAHLEAHHWGHPAPPAFRQEHRT